MTIAGNILILVTTVEAWAFCVLYQLLAPWWRTTMGRNVMTYGLVVAVLLTLSSVRIVAGAGLETTWFQIVRLVVFGGLPLAIGWRIAILLRVQRDKRH